MSLFDISFNTIYVVAAITAILFSIKADFSNDTTSLNRKGNYLSIAIILIPLLFIIGLRSYEIGADTLSYKFAWDNIALRESLGMDFIFIGMMKFLNYIGFSYRGFLTVVAFLYLLLLYIGIRKLGKDYKANPFLILFALISMFFFLSMGINVVRQGVAMGLFFVFVVYYNNISNLKKLTLALLSVFTHFTSILPFIIYFIIVKLPKLKIKTLLFIYLFSLVISSLSLGVLDLAKYALIFVDDQRAGYFSGEESLLFQVGFKPQFVVFNTVFLFIFLYIHKKMKEYDMTAQLTSYQVVLKYYILMSSIFFIMFQIPYSDRVGLMSWIAIPILLAPAFSADFKIRGSKLTTTLFVLLIFIFFKFYG